MRGNASISSRARSALATAGSVLASTTERISASGGPGARQTIDSWMRTWKREREWGDDAILRIQMQPGWAVKRPLTDLRQSESQNRPTS